MKSQKDVQTVVVEAGEVEEIVGEVEDGIIIVDTRAEVEAGADAGVVVDVVVVAVTVKGDHALDQKVLVRVVQRRKKLELLGDH